MRTKHLHSILVPFFLGPEPLVIMYTVKKPHVHLRIWHVMWYNILIPSEVLSFYDTAWYFWMFIYCDVHVYMHIVRLESCAC